MNILYPEILKLIALAWLSILITEAWINIFWDFKYLKTMKPFACEICLAFWIGVIYSIFTLYAWFEYASLLSITTFLIQKIKQILNKLII